LLTHAVFYDFAGLVITTDDASAAHAYSRGIHLLITSSADAVDLLRDAVTVDPGFALARVALALAVDARRPPGEQHECAAGADTTSAGATRRERQHIEVIRLVLNGENERAAVLGREHLREFPNDVVVSYLLASRGLA